VLAGDGKIIRYLYGTEFLPFDIGMAVSEALQGTPGVSIKKFLSYCFEYDPEKNSYTFKLIKVFGIVTLTFVAGFLFFLIKKDKRKA
jgi:protein SCO1/2